ncbi:hypothetical protein PAXINDRAFT_14516 [Paxillus involutus ATCC 200175]|uniref:Uncharacterized protein n=1 Tax=Paxillus involutus ATCC 200175 TaxID=664439 RepID=A0A0C9TZ75_PAXIN|nr:hypothetical protein PAXINDRAFT_14516 [Paxillus involutus ATCC 200175]
MSFHLSVTEAVDDTRNDRDMVDSADWHEKKNGTKTRNKTVSAKKEPKDAVKAKNYEISLDGKWIIARSVATM